MIIILDYMIPCLTSNKYPFFNRRGVEALDAIHRCNGFDQASKIMGLSQSAISQRFKELQRDCNDPLLIRSQPYSLTNKGQALVDYLQALRQLETSTLEEMSLSYGLPSLNIGLSRDTLETWFLSLLISTGLMEKAHVSLITVDQNETLRLLKRGEANLTISPIAKSLNKQQPTYIGNMDYILVATAGFRNRFFEKSKTFPENLLNAPCLVYDQHDHLYQHYLENFWNVQTAPRHVHMMPSVIGFKKMVLTGIVLALIPYVDVQQEIDSGVLVNLAPQQTWNMPLYLHTSDFLTSAEKKLINIIVRASQSYLKQSLI